MAYERSAEIYLIFSRGERYGKLSVRLAKTKPAMNSGERFMKLDLIVPDKIFDTPQFAGKIRVPEDAAGTLEIDTSQMQDYFKKQFGLELTISKIEENEEK